MGALSRWSGGLLDRFGARLPLTVGPAIAALGFALFALAGADSPYWLAFLLPVTCWRSAMTIAVAPLTTTVINAVPTHQAGVASGVNNAVASMASLLAVAIFGAVALAAFDGGLDRRLAAQPVSPQVEKAVAESRGKFVIKPALTGLAMMTDRLRRRSCADRLPAA